MPKCKTSLCTLQKSLFPLTQLQLKAITGNWDCGFCAHSTLFSFLSLIKYFLVWSSLYFGGKAWNHSFCHFLCGWNFSNQIDYFSVFMAPKFCGSFYWIFFRWTAMLQTDVTANATNVDNWMYEYFRKKSRYRHRRHICGRRCNKLIAIRWLASFHGVNCFSCYENSTGPHDPPARRIDVTLPPLLALLWAFYGIIFPVSGLSKSSLTWLLRYEKYDKLSIIRVLRAVVSPLCTRMWY